jgi:hypothetical protein
MHPALKEPTSARSRDKIAPGMTRTRKLRKIHPNRLSALSLLYTFYLKKTHIKIKTIKSKYLFIEINTEKEHSAPPETLLTLFNKSNSTPKSTKISLTSKEQLCLQNLSDTTGGKTPPNQKSINL